MSNAIQKKKSLDKFQFFKTYQRKKLKQKLI